TAVAELPLEIGSLSHLQTLEVFETGLKKLPISVGKLSKLMRLHLSLKTRFPPGVLERPTSLQDVAQIIVLENLAVELGKLTDLRTLKIHVRNQKDEANSWAQDLGAMPMLIKHGFGVLASSVGASNNVGLENLPLLKDRGAQ
ncbi:hypothetical protein E2562_037483, partial [Oryza meyeriana var. granulata]